MIMIMANGACPEGSNIPRRHVTLTFSRRVASVRSGTFPSLQLDLSFSPEPSFVESAILIGKPVHTVWILRFYL